MKCKLTESDVLFYRGNGFIVIEDFLFEEELGEWREAVTKRNGIKIPGQNVQVGMDDGINEDTEYFSKVFDRLINLWQTSGKVKEIMLDERIGKMAATLAGADEIRIWHDQALFKNPWANPTSWHLDTPFWSFSDRNALSIWVALDDATLENGCLYFIPGSHRKTTFENKGIGENMGGIFDVYPRFKNKRSVPSKIKAGSCSFHNGFTIHGAGTNMTNGYRRAMYYGAGGQGMLCHRTNSDLR
ncbi:phytanoyl-CoA dioxygenase family protein [Niabella aurantiaca]|uniref:phytanoyl-CoA dioxygenase family protein n=1 Tax=Niabella aurantiaca TaxID=379900 RepID=UPI000374B57E|nr:phytanoyl-CoA dioxygenase family protein [Niabella aurantiaca]